MKRGSWKVQGDGSRLAVLLSSVLAAWSLAEMIVSSQQGMDDIAVVPILFTCLYASGAVLLFRGSRAGRYFALAAALPSLLINVWVLLESSFALARAGGGVARSAVPGLFVTSVLGASLNALLIQDAFAKPLAIPVQGQRLSRIRDIPSWVTVSLQLLAGLAILGFAVFGGPERWRYAKISGALTGAALIVFATSIALAKALDLAYGRLTRRKKFHTQET